jgi:hypothetical protein
MYVKWSKQIFDYALFLSIWGTSAQVALTVKSAQVQRGMGEKGPAGTLGLILLLPLCSSRLMQSGRR